MAMWGGGSRRAILPLVDLPQLRPQGGFQPGNPGQRRREVLLLLPEPPLQLPRLAPPCNR